MKKVKINIKNHDAIHTQAAQFYDWKKGQERRDDLGSAWCFFQLSSLAGWASPPQDGQGCALRGGSPTCYWRRSSEFGFCSPTDFSLPPGLLPFLLGILWSTPAWRCSWKKIEWKVHLHWIKKKNIPEPPVSHLSPSPISEAQNSFLHRPAVILSLSLSIGAYLANERGCMLNSRFKLFY